MKAALRIAQELVASLDKHSYEYGCISNHISTSLYDALCKGRINRFKYNGNVLSYSHKNHCWKLNRKNLDTNYLNTSQELEAQAKIEIHWPHATIE